MSKFISTLSEVGNGQTWRNIDLYIQANHPYTSIEGHEITIHETGDYNISAHILAGSDETYYNLGKDWFGAVLLQILIDGVPIYEGQHIHNYVTDRSQMRKPVNITVLSETLAQGAKISFRYLTTHKNNGAPVNQDSFHANFAAVVRKA